MNITRQQLMTAMVTAVLGLAIAAPAAAEVWPDGRNGAELSYRDALDRAIANHKTYVLAPDDRIRVSALGQSTPVSPPSAASFYTPQALKADGLRVQAMVRAYAGPAKPVAASPSSGAAFDWGAAGIGATSSAALLLALGAGIAMARRSRAGSTAV